MSSPSSFSRLRAFIALVLMLCCLLSLFSCKNKLHTLAVRGSDYLDKKTDTTYKALPASYEPALIFIMSAGAFFTLAFVVAGMNKILASLKKKKEVK